MWLIRGFVSWAKRILQVDAQAAAYIIFGGPKRSFWTYLPYVFGFIAVVLAWIRNPALGATLLVAAFLVALMLLYILGRIPKLRWHFLNHEMYLKFLDPMCRKSIATDTMRLRAITKYCDELTVPRSFGGSIAIGRLVVGGEEMKETTTVGIPGYRIERFPGDWAVQVKFHRPVRFGDEITVLIEWEEEDGYTNPEEFIGFDARTLIDSLSITVCFHSQAYPAALVAQIRHGVSVEADKSFVPTKTWHEPDHICETWRLGEVLYGRNYDLRWTWPPQIRRN